MLFGKSKKRGIRWRRGFYQGRRSFFKRRQSFRNPGIYTPTPKQETFLTLPVRSLVGVTFLILIVGLVVVIFFSPLFVIRDIVVVGNYHLLGSDIRSVTNKALKEHSSFIFPIGHIFFLDKKEMALDLEKELPLIQEVKFERNFPDILKVRIKERNPVFVWESRKHYYYIDRNGYAYLEITAQEKQASRLLSLRDEANIKIELGSKVVTSSFVDFVNTLILNFKPRIGVGIKEIILPLTTLEVRVVTEEGWKAYFDTTRSARIQLRYLASVLKQINKPRNQLEYIDLRLKDRIFYK